jgi:hypothetical protein
MELFNKGERHIGTSVTVKGDDGSLSPVAIAPQSALDVPEDEAKKLLELYPDELIETKNMPVSTSEVDALKARIAELEAQLAETAKATLKPKAKAE